MRTVCVIVGVGVLAAVLPAKADIIPSYVSAIASGGNTIVTYQIDLAADQNANTGDFFTIYDFGSIIPDSNTQPSGWTFSTSLVGVNPPKTNAPDDPSILNLTWTYSGPALSGTGIGPFTVTIAGTSNSDVVPLRDGFFAAQGTLIVGPNAGTEVSNVGQIPIPLVPEPSAGALIVLSLVGGGLGLLIARLRRRQLSS
ncbi:MAG TPA: hypothetical protein VEI58_04890 [Chthoniobacterales bacterium]|nr:hypothetical protein [Chthoniobacterales bacterium]